MAFTVMSLSVLQCHCPQQLPWCQRSISEPKELQGLREAKPCTIWFHSPSLWEEVTFTLISKSDLRSRKEREWDSSESPWHSKQASDLRVRESVRERELFTEQGPESLAPLLPRHTKKGVSLYTPENLSVSLSSQSCLPSPPTCSCFQGSMNCQQVLTSEYPVLISR